MKKATYMTIREFAPFLSSRTGGVISRADATDILVKVLKGDNIDEVICGTLNAVAYRESNGDCNAPTADDIAKRMGKYVSKEQLYWLIAVTAEVLERIENDET